MNYDNVFDFSVKEIDGNDYAIGNLKGKVLLILNTATQCGLTPQYEALEKVYEQYKNEGFEILDFPSNQFLEQAPGTNKEIDEFCTLNYNTKFKRFAKVDVNGENESPLFTYLKAASPKEEIDERANDFHKILEELKQTWHDTDIKWNFTKFLVGRDGKVIKRYHPTVTPEEITADIEKALAQQPQK